MPCIAISYKIPASQIMSNSSVIVTGLIFTVSPPLEGELWYISATNTVSRAQANALDTSRVVGISGNPPDELITSQGIVCPVLFVPGLTLNAGDVVYLDASTAGQATNVPPSSGGQYIAPQGFVLDPSTYNPSVGGLALVVPQRGVLAGPL